MSGTARKPTTWADIEAVADERPYREILDGELSHKPETTAWHSLAQGEISGVLAPARSRRDGGGGGGDGWWILTEPPVVLAETVMVRPDVAGWRLSRLPALPNGPIRSRMDWVCEILSRGHERRDKRDKFALYARFGVPHYWLVDPTARLLEAYTLHGDLYARVGCWTDEDPVARIPPFDFDLDPRRFFAPRGLDEGPLRFGEGAPAAYGS